MLKTLIRGGHTKVSPGATGFIDEYTECQKIKEEVIKLLSPLGEIVVGDNNLPYPGELNFSINKANNEGVQKYYSIHMNSCDNETANGVELLRYSDTKDDTKRILDNLSKLGFLNRGVKFRTDLGELKRTSMDSTIIEVCFVSSRKDTDLYKKIGYKDIAFAIATGIEPSVKREEETVYRVQVGAFKDKKNADDLLQKLKEKGFDGYVK